MCFVIITNIHEVIWLRGELQHCGRTNIFSGRGFARQNNVNQGISGRGPFGPCSTLLNPAQPCSTLLNPVQPAPRQQLQPRDVSSHKLYRNPNGPHTKRPITKRPIQYQNVPYHKIKPMISLMSLGEVKGCHEIFDLQFFFMIRTHLCPG